MLQRNDCYAVGNWQDSPHLVFQELWGRPLSLCRSKSCILPHLRVNMSPSNISWWGVFPWKLVGWHETRQKKKHPLKAHAESWWSQGSWCLANRSCWMSRGGEVLPEGRILPSLCLNQPSRTTLFSLINTPHGYTTSKMYWASPLAIQQHSYKQPRGGLPCGGTTASNTKTQIYFFPQ